MSGPALDRRVVEPSTRSFISRIYQCGPWGQTHLFSKAPFCPQLQGEQKPPIIAGLECGGACAVCVSVCGSLSPLGCHEERRLEESSRLCVWGGWIGGGKRVLFPPPRAPFLSVVFVGGGPLVNCILLPLDGGMWGRGGHCPERCQVIYGHAVYRHVIYRHGMSPRVIPCHPPSEHVIYSHIMLTTYTTVQSMPFTVHDESMTLQTCYLKAHYVATVTLHCEHFIEWSVSKKKFMLVADWSIKMV
jgi:hypothetical protein